MTINIIGLKIPYYLGFLIISAVTFGFIVWRSRKNLGILRENVFDLIILFIVCSLILSRVLYVLENLQQFSQMSWSVYPFYYEPGAERIWFKQLPWGLVKFWDSNINFQALLLGGIAGTFIVKKIRKLSSEFLTNVVYALCWGNIVQIIGFWVAKNYIGEVTTSFIGISYGDARLRYPVQLIEASILLLFMILIWYLRKKQKRISAFGLYLFVLGTLEVLTVFITDIEKEVYTITASQIVFLIMTFIGIVILIFSKEVGFQHTGDTVAVLPSIGKGVKGGEEYNGKKVRYSYRDFQRSYATYKTRSGGSGVNPFTRVFAKLKRKIRARGNVNQEGENG